MNCLEIQKEIALTICSIGNHIIQDDVPINENCLDLKEIKDNKQNLLKLLIKYNNHYPVNFSKAPSVILEELRSVTEKKELNYIYEENGNRFPLYFGLSILGLLEI